MGHSSKQCSRVCWAMRSLAFTWRNGSIEQTSNSTFPSAAVLWTGQGWVNDRDQAAASAAATFSFCLTGLFFRISLQVKPSHPNVSQRRTLETVGVRRFVILVKH